MVGDDDQLPPAACHDAGPDDSTWRGCRDRRAQRGGEVDPAVEAEPRGPNGELTGAWRGHASRIVGQSGSGVDLSKTMVRRPATPSASAPA